MTEDLILHVDPTQKDCVLHVLANGRSISDYEMSLDEAKSLQKELTMYINNQKPQKVTKVSELFVSELDYIQDDEIRNITREMMDLFPLDPFLYKGASSSGKYHPAECRGALGLTLHTKYAVQAGLVLLDQDTNLDENDHDKDLIISALLLHDGFKYGLNGTEQHTVANHPDLIADFLLDRSSEYDADSSKAFYLHQLADLTRSHHGKWGDTPCNNRRKEYVHIADMMASRAHLIRFKPMT